MPGGVHDGAVGHIGEHLLGSLDSHDVGGIVEGSQILNLTELLNDLRSHDDGLGELVAAVYHTVSHRTNLLHVGDDASGGIGDGLDNQLDGLLVGGAGLLLHKLILSLCLVGNDGSVLSHPLHNAGSQYILFAPIIHLIFSRGATAVQCQNNHSIPRKIKSILPL